MHEPLEQIGSLDGLMLIAGKPLCGQVARSERRVVRLEPGHDPDEVVRLAAGLERASEHPLGAAIIAEAETRAHPPARPSSFRSITGGGLRRTLNLLQEVAPFDLFEVPSGTVCYDWTVPDEWNVRDAYVADSTGKRLIDFQENNVHLVNYSIPFEGTLTFEELAPHLYTLPDLPSAVPYRTTYYNRTWGFCLTHEQFQELDRSGMYHVVVDASLAPGSLTYGEALLPATGWEALATARLAEVHPLVLPGRLIGLLALGTFLSDLVLAWIDPRLRRERA